MENENSLRHYIIFHKAWYYKANDPTESKREITIQIGNNEFVIEWVDLGVDHGCAPRAKIFDDAFAVFVECPKLFEKMAWIGQGATIERFAAMLNDLGFADATPYERP